MAKFAKLIELPNEQQVLVEMKFNSDTAEHQVSARTELAGVSVSVVFTYETEEQTVAALGMFSRTDAVEFRRSAEEALNG